MLINRRVRPHTALLAAAFPFLAGGQEMAPLFTHRMAAGGVSNSVDALLLGGTIGQWDAFAPGVDGAGEPWAAGFWHAEVLPSLRIQRSGDGVVLSWPAALVGFRLEMATALGKEGEWNEVQQDIKEVEDENQITISAGALEQFFRLHRP